MGKAQSGTKNESLEQIEIHGLSASPRAMVLPDFGAECLSQLSDQAARGQE